LIIVTLVHPHISASGRGAYFSTTSGNITDETIMNYLDPHTNQNGFSPNP
jgi:putative transposase